MKVLLNNRKVLFDYEILESYEAGLVLTGAEIKSLIIGKASLTDSYCYFNNFEVFIKSLRIEQYRGEGDPERNKKLLLNKKEIYKIKEKLEQKGLTLVPLKIYLKNRKAKVEICIARGKKKFDKRESIKERDLKREQNRYAKKE